MGPVFENLSQRGYRGVAGRGKQVDKVNKVDEGVGKLKRPAFFAGKMKRAPWMNRLDQDELAAFDDLKINWSPREVQEMESWGLGIRLIDVQNLFDYPTERFQEGAYRIFLALTRLFPGLKDRNGVRVVHARIRSDKGEKF